MSALAHRHDGVGPGRLPGGSGIARAPFLAWMAAVALSGAPAARATEVNVSGAPARMTVRLTLGEYQRRPTPIDGQPYEVLLLPGEPPTREAGAPSVPRVCRALIVPDDAEMSVRVVDAVYHELAMKLAPSRGSLPRSVDPATVPYRFGPAYEQDAFYPGDLARLRPPHILREHRGVVVELLPFQYNPVRGVLRVYTELTVEVVAVGPGRTNVLTRAAGVTRDSAAFEPVYRRHFLNHARPERYDPLYEEGSLLVICHDPWLAYLQPLVEHKRAAGMETSLVPASTAGSTPEGIKAFIQQVYDTGNLSFVLLVGDAEHVPPGRYEMDQELAASDPAYSLLAGDDSYPDVVVGRFSADTPEDVATQVERTVVYERAPATGQPWFWRGTGIGSDGGPGDDGEMDWEHIANIRALLLDYGFTEVDPFYDPDEIDPQEVREALDAGRGILNFCGHGASGGWGTSTFGFGLADVDSLLNANMLPFISAVACSTGQFEGVTCLGEAFLRATHNGQPSGAIGFFGSSVSQWWSEPMEAQDELNLLFVAEQCFSYGALCYAGCCSMMDKYGPGSAPMFMTWHVFGDPSLRVVGSIPPPAGLAVEPYASLMAGGPPGGSFSPRSITYTLTNHGDTARDYAAACQAPWVDLAGTGGTLPPGGQAEVTVALNELAEDLDNGFHEAAVVFQDLTGGDWTSTRMVILEVNARMPAHVFPLNEQPDWTMTGEWDFGQPTGQGAVEHGYPDPPAGATGLNVFGVNLEGDYSAEPGGPFHLTTTPIDCFGLVDVQLRFSRWLNTDFNPYVFATLEASDDGAHWTLIWQNPGGELVDRAWSEYVYDLSHVADLTSTVYLRWGYEKGAPAYPYSGWNIDDIEIWGRQAAEMPDLYVTPQADLVATGPLGGPFTPPSRVYSLINQADMPIDFLVECGAAWIDVTPASGTVPEKGKVKVTVSVNSVAEDLPNGWYASTLLFTNTTTHDGDTKRMATLDINAPGLVHAVDLDVHPGWSMSGEWDFGQPAGQGGDEHGNPDPTAGATGPMVCGVNLQGDYSLEAGGPYHLTTTAFDCSGLDGIELRFQRWLNSDYQPYVYATIEASNNGVDWTPVWDNGESEVAEDAWSLQACDLSDVADDQPAVFLRWGYEVHEAAYAYSGWNIDDVQIWGKRYASLGDYDNDGDVDLADFAAFADCLSGPWEADPFVAPAAECLEAFDTEGDGDVDAADFGVFQTAFTTGLRRPGL